MIYTERDRLAILELQEERTSFSYEELFQILMKRPSHAIYVELNGLLYGIITIGRIRRAFQSNLKQVGINTNFKSVAPGESMKAREIFHRARMYCKEAGRIDFLPVVNFGGKLLGAYTKADHLLSIEYSLTLLDYLNVSIFEGHLILVKPCVNTQTKQRLFLKLEQTLEQKGLMVETIDFCQVSDYCNTADYILLTDAEEQKTSALLCEYFVRGKNYQASLICYQQLLLRLIDNTDGILQYFQSRNIHILLYGLEENESGYLKKFQNELEQNYRKRSRYVSSALLPEMKEEFLGDLYELLKDEKMPIGVSLHMQGNVVLPRDKNNSVIHVKNGHRLTVGQPVVYDRCVYVYGPCTVKGPYVDDQNTIPSLLQKKINSAGLQCRVENCYSPVRAYKETQIFLLGLLLTTPFKQGDIIILDKWNTKLTGYQSINLVDIVEQRQLPATWFIDSIRHCNHKANQVFADAFYEALLPVLRQPAGTRDPVEIMGDPIDLCYLNQYFASFDPSVYKTIGSIVMNCNPFTLGHRYLIEEALKQVEFLIVFVVDENRSVFSFEERLAMVYAGTADLDHIRIVPSGEFILSDMTFPEYFVKETDEELIENTENDITLFAERIAPKLGITHRFVGEEPEDLVTNTYNQAMKRILPPHGIQLIEIPRKQSGPEVISASRVRKCLEENDLALLSTLVPDTTKDILFYANE